MTETTFLLIRHGEHALGQETIAGRLPVSLSALGQEQAAGLVPRLAHVSITALYSSPVQRARETAAPLAEHLGLPVQLRDALAEIDFGDWTGQPFEALQGEERWTCWNTFRSGTQAPNGERMGEVQERMVAEMHRLWQDNPGGTVALFSHGDVIKAAVAYYLGVPLDLFLRIEISLASVTAIRLTPYGPQVLCVNHTGPIAL